MKTITTILTLILTFEFAYSQIEKGKYQVCLDLCYYDYCHARLSFDFKDNDTCEIKYEDDVTIEISQGFYQVNDSMITFIPKIRPESIQISYKYERKGNGLNQSYLEYQQKDNENVVWILDLSDNRLANIDLLIYRGDTITDKLKTDSTGYARYYGEVADSITLKIHDRIFRINPNKQYKPSWIKLYIDFNYLDLFDRVKGLKYEKGIYWFEYECDNNLIKKRILKRIN